MIGADDIELITIALRWHSGACPPPLDQRCVYLADELERLDADQRAVLAAALEIAIRGRAA